MISCRLRAVWERLILAVISGSIAAQIHAQTSPVELAQAVVQRWSAGPATEFKAVYPFREGQDAFSETLSGQFVRTAGLANVVRASSDRAVLLISGTPQMFNSGDETILGRGFSGVYEARLQDGNWKLATRIPLEDMGQILSHRIKVFIHPASGISVEDRMRIRVKGNNGFAVRLNHAAKLEAVRATTGRAANFFGGGLFWADLPEGETELIFKYSIKVEEGPNDTNSGCFLKKAGHVRNQYFWHPFFDFNSGGDLADFDVEIRIPKEYKVSSSIPQTESLRGEERVIHGKTIRPTFALTLVYDREWNIESERFGEIRFESFVTPQFQPNAELIGKEFRSVYALLSQRFGAPQGGYFGVVEARSKEGNGWHFTSNQIVVAAGWPRFVSTKEKRPRAYLGHEIAHLWTEGAGPAANFLREGWATYAESLILTTEFGPETAKAFWKYQSDDYFRQYDTKASLLEDENNSGVAYSKGAWLFHMLEDALGTEGFQKAVAEYSRISLAEPSGWEKLADSVQRYAPPDFNARSFLLPWLTEKRAPHLTVQVNGSTITIHQDAPYFFLPVTIEVTTASGIERRRVWIKEAETAVAFSNATSNVQIDPAGALLLRH